MRSFGSVCQAKDTSPGCNVATCCFEHSYSMREVKRSEFCNRCSEKGWKGQVTYYCDRALGGNKD